LKGQFLEFDLVDKVFPKEVRIDRNVTDTVGLDYGPKPRIWKFYTRNKTKLAKE
jgi:hypothetical protein